MRRAFSNMRGVFVFRAYDAEHDRYQPAVDGYVLGCGMSFEWREQTYDWTNGNPLEVVMKASVARREAIEDQQPGP